MMEIGEEAESVFMREGSCPFQIDLIRKLMFSHMENKDLLSARLVSKDWSRMATVEYRGRTTNFHWIGRRGEGPRRGLIDELDEVSAVKFLDVMTPSPLVPVQQIALRLDLLCIEPCTFIRLVSFIAPWVKVLRFCPWSTVVDVACGMGTRIVAWAPAVDDLTGLQFPCLETLEVERGNSRLAHPCLAMALMMITKKILEGARNLQTFEYEALLFEENWDSMGANRQAMKVLTQALRPSVKRLGFGVTCTVDYEALTTVNLQLEDFCGKALPQTAGALLKFLERQKGSLRRLSLFNLEGIYGPEFPQFPRITELSMKDVQVDSTLNCLQAFPAVGTLLIEMEPRVQWDRSPQAGPTNFGQFPANPSVRNLTIRAFVHKNLISFALIANVLPNITHVDFTCWDESCMTQLFTHLSNLQSLRLQLLQPINYEEAETILSGIPRAISSLTKDYSISDDTAFDAISVIASGDPSSMVGLTNLKDLRVLSISDPSAQYERILTKLFLHAVVRKMPKLEEIRLIGEVKTDPILEALEKRGVRVRKIIG